MKSIVLLLFLFIMATTIALPQNVCGPYYEITQNAELLKKQKHIDQIAQKIWSTISQPFRIPEIICYQEKNSRADAIYCPNKNIIYFGSNLYDICMEIGEESLSASIAHEMGHYFYHHSFAYSASGHAFSSREAEIADSLNIEVSEEMEAQADIFAAFKCFSAGINILEAMPETLRKVYKHNQINEKGSLYLPLSKRLQIVKNAHKVFRDLLPLFNTAKTLYLIGDFKTAGDLFALISKDYTSWEIYVNAAICYAMEALNHMNEESKKYIFPFQMQTNSNLSKINDFAQRGINKMDDQDYARWMLSESYNMMRKAIDKNNQVFSNHLAMSGIEYYRNDIASANSYAEEAIRLANNNFEKALALTSKGIIMNAIDNDNVADQVFTDALSKDSLSITLYNYCRFKNMNCSEFSDNSDEILSGPPEKICSFIPFALLLDDEFIWPDTIMVQEISDKQIFIKDTIGCKIIRIDDNVIIETKPLYENSTGRGIMINSNKNEVLNKYGNPNIVRVYGNNEFLIYQSIGIGFEIENEKVKSWMIYNL